MRLSDLLIEKKSSILKRWFDVIVESYPSETAAFLKNRNNQFTNPVGSTILDSIEGIFGELMDGANPDNISKFLDDVIRIRAVQDFTPSGAIAFIFLLKKVIREELEVEIKDNQLSGEMMAFELKVDNVALSAFDTYMRCREKIYEIKANEVRRMTFRLLQQARLITDVPELNSGEVSGPNLKEDINLNKEER
jgi:hypothetical protein